MLRNDKHCHYDAALPPEQVTMTPLISPFYLLWWQTTAGKPEIFSIDFWSSRVKRKRELRTYERGGTSGFRVASPSAGWPQQLHTLSFNFFICENRGEDLFFQINEITYMKAASITLRHRGILIKISSVHPPTYPRTRWVTSVVFREYQGLWRTSVPRHPTPTVNQRLKPPEKTHQRARR